MKYLKQIFTLILCLNFVGIFVFSNFFNSNTIEISSKIFGSELESEIEAESETASESEQNSKNHLKFYNFSDYFYFKSLILTNKNLHNTILSYLDHILEVPTSPPNNC